MIVREVAINEINKWLDYKKVGQKKRENLKENIDNLIDAVEEGSLILNEDFTLTYNIKYPIESEMPVTKLTFKPRLKTQTVYNHLNGVKSSDVDGRLHAYIAALTTNTKAVIQALDTDDTSFCQNIAIFFL